MAEEEVVFQFYKGDDYLALPRDPQPWLIEQLVPSGGVMNLYGKPKLGKSFGSLGIACAVSDSECTQWLGHNVLKHGPVTYLQVDTPRTEWAGRIQKIKDAGHRIDNIFFTDANLVPYPMNITEGAIKERLKKIIDAQQPLLLVVDTLREVHGEDENDSGAMRNVINSLVMVTKDAGCALLLVSHSRKEYGGGSRHGGKDDGGKGDLMDDNRGSTYIPGRMDVIAKLTDKYLHVKGRAIGMKRIGIVQGEAGMLHLNSEKAQSDANVKHVLSQAELSGRQQAELLAALEGIEIEAARSRIRYYREKQTSKIQSLTLD